MKTILITGANGNLGSSVVRILHSKGYGICATVGSGGIPKDYDNMTLDTRHVNLTEESAVNNYVAELARSHPQLNAAVLLVGGFAMGGIRETDNNALDKQIALNFKSAYFVVRPLIAYFEQHEGGQFILIGARPALHPESGKEMIAYALSKSLVVQLAEIINAYGKGKQISATVIVPGTIDTEANRKAMPDADFTTWVKAEAIAETIATILSDPVSHREGVLKMYHET